VFEKALQVLELFHGADQLFQVLQPTRGVGGSVLLPHLGVAGFIEHDFGELGVGKLLALGAPALEGSQKIAQACPRLRLHFLGLDQESCCLHQRNAARTCKVMQPLQRGVAEPSLRDVHDALEAEIIRR
jgi:hypothetical protein